MTVRFELGQAVRWPPAPSKIAQIVELRRRTVRLFYRTKKRGGRERFPIVSAGTLKGMQDPTDPILPLFNPFGRAILKRFAKEFKHA